MCALWDPQACVTLNALYAASLRKATGVVRIAEQSVSIGTAVSATQRPLTCTGTQRVTPAVRCSPDCFRRTRPLCAQLKSSPSQIPHTERIFQDLDKCFFASFEFPRTKLPHKALKISQESTKWWVTQEFCLGSISLE